MTKFEQVGVNYQYDADTKEAARRAFRYSCNCCCNRGMKIDCEKCSIAFVHSLVIACFDNGKTA